MCRFQADELLDRLPSAYLGPHSTPPTVRWLSPIFPCLSRGPKECPRTCYPELRGYDARMLGPTSDQLLHCRDVRGPLAEFHSPGERCADVHDPLVPHTVRQGELDGGCALVECIERPELVNVPYRRVA